MYPARGHFPVVGFCIQLGGTPQWWGCVSRGQEWGQAVKAENLEGQAVKGTSQIRKSQGSSQLKVNRIPNLIKARYHIGQAVKAQNQGQNF